MWCLLGHFPTWFAYARQARVEELNHGALWRQWHVKNTQQKGLCVTARINMSPYGAWDRIINCLTRGKFWNGLEGYRSFSFVTNRLSPSIQALLFCSSYIRAKKNHDFRAQSANEETGHFLFQSFYGGVTKITCLRWRGLCWLQRAGENGMSERGLETHCDDPRKFSVNEWKRDRQRNRPEISNPRLMTCFFCSTLTNTFPLNLLDYQK